MSANDPKRTWLFPNKLLPEWYSQARYGPWGWTHEAARISRCPYWRGGMAAGGARAVKSHCPGGRYEAG